MPKIDVEELPPASVKITVTLTPDELTPFLEDAAARITEETPIPGFRPGKGGFEIVKQRVGEMKIYEEALEPIIRKFYVSAVIGGAIETVGSPKIDVAQLVPGNDLIFTAEVLRLPRVTKLADYTNLSIEKQPVEVAEKDVDVALKDLQRMQTKEIRVPSGTAASGDDKMVMSMNMKKDGVPVEGGQSTGHAVFLKEEHYIPGFTEQVAGLKEGDTKTFTLKFPEEGATKMLAGAMVEFEVAIKEIYHLDHPALDDAFAKSLGQEDFQTLKTLISGNLKSEKDVEETQRQEKEVLEKLAKESSFEEIPDLLLNQEINKMTEELQRGVEEQGGEFESYLKSIKRTIADLKIDFTPQALMRVKVGLILREVAKRAEIKVSDEEIDTQLDRMAERYDDNEEAKKRLYTPEYREYAQAMLTNRKTIAHLVEAMVK